MTESVQQDIEKLRNFPALQLGKWPTPVSSVRLTSGHQILVKRDDLSNFGRGGVKTRRLESFIGYALAQNYEELVTEAGNVSNLAHDLSLIEATYSIRIRLFLHNRPHMKRPVREKVFKNVSAEKHFLGGNDRWVRTRMRMYQVWATLRGTRCLVVPASLAGPASVIGAARGYLEMHEQLAEATPETVFITAASGCTQAGFILAESLLRKTGKAPTQICGVKVGWGSTKSWVHSLIHATEKLLKLEQQIPLAAVAMDTRMAHHGFGNFDIDLVQLCERVSRQHGIQIDPVYGGKTWSVMEYHLQEQRANIEPNQVLYWHCGYTPDWRHFYSPST